jgi:hypothetical protein
VAPRIKFRALHDLDERRGRGLLFSDFQVLMPDITFANDSGGADNDRPAPAIADAAA